MKKDAEQYSPKETELRLKAALHGARIAGHKPMQSMTPKRGKAQRKKKRL